ncbi:hypothetical protein TRIUR3_19719 [Triticum urartu]|uniref:Uncharacterized protein n=1 Tax=Triticum urartu TaxID=4572 RepID=M7ZA97_TRIUA|nr:hypothetical protein TRIUR3_19719 [Triticum urartu]
MDVIISGSCSSFLACKMVKRQQQVSVRPALVECDGPVCAVEKLIKIDSLIALLCCKTIKLALFGLCFGGINSCYPVRVIRQWKVVFGVAGRGSSGHDHKTRLLHSYMLFHVK